MKTREQIERKAWCYWAFTFSGLGQLMVAIPWSIIIFIYDVEDNFKNVSFFMICQLAAMYLGYEYHCRTWDRRWRGY